MGFENIRLLVLDVDGTMTDGGVYIDNNRVESKRFSIKDGAGILMAKAAGIEVMILTGRESNCVAQRASELGIQLIFQNVKAKSSFLQGYLEDNGLTKENVAYMGDDLNDLFAMRHAGLCACPSDAAQEIKNQCGYIVEQKGGDGAVRAFIEIILKARGQWEQSIQREFSECYQRRSMRCLPVGGIVSWSSRAEAFFAVLNLKEKLAWDFTNPRRNMERPLEEQNSN